MNRGRSDDSFDASNIGLGYAELWVSQLVSKFTVVGHDDQTGCFGIQSTNVEDSVVTHNKLAEVATAVFVCHRTDDTVWLIKC